MWLRLPGPAPQEYTDLVLCRDIFHCTPSQLYDQDYDVVQGIIIAAVAALALVAALAMAATTLGKAKGRLSGLSATHEKMLDAKDELGTIGERVRQLEARKKTTRVKNAVQAVEMLISPLGLKDKMKSLKAQPGGGAAPSCCGGGGRCPW